MFSGNLAIGTGTSGSQAEGGAINAGGFGGGPGGGTITISGSTSSWRTRPWETARASIPRIKSGDPPRGRNNTYPDCSALTFDTFSGNRAAGGSGPFLQYALGGAINSQLYSYYTPSPSLATTISDSLFIGNQAIGGTGIPSYETYVDGGALAFADTPASVTDSSFIGNSALGSPGTGRLIVPSLLRGVGLRRRSRNDRCGHWNSARATS